jgi:hypothetical protein
MSAIDPTSSRPPSNRCSDAFARSACDGPGHLRPTGHRSGHRAPLESENDPRTGIHSSAGPCLAVATATRSRALPLTSSQPLARSLFRSAGPCDPGSPPRGPGAWRARIPTVAWTTRRHRHRKKLTRGQRLETRGTGHRSEGGACPASGIPDHPRVPDRARCPEP